MISFLEQYPQLKIIRGLSQARRLRIYLVGGFLRDLFLKRTCLDFDFAVEKDAVDFAQRFARTIKGVFVLLDQENGCARVVKKYKGQSLIFDFADFRAPNLRADLAHRDFTINTLCLDLNEDNVSLRGGTFLSDDEVLRQAQDGEQSRTTIYSKKIASSRLKDVGTRNDANNLFDRVLDFRNAKRDLKQKTIRMVSSKAFEEDPLRLLRAFSLRAALGFKIEAQTLARIKKDRSLLKDVSTERIRDEFFKIFASSRAAENLKAMDKIGLLEEVIPQIRVMFDVKQGGYHHLDVWPHSLETVRQLEKILNKGVQACLFSELKNQPPLPHSRKAGTGSCEQTGRPERPIRDEQQEELTRYLNERLSGTRLRRDLLKLAALLHDIGKPDTQKQEKDRMSFHGHEHVGAAIVRSVARMLKLSVRERHMLEDIVRWHLRPGYLSNFKKPSERSIFRYFRDTKEEAVSILLLSLADQRSTRGPLTTEADQKHHEHIVRKLIDRYFEMKRQKPFVRLINGHDLIKKLKLKPSPIFAKILRDVEEKQALGKVQSKEEALALAKKIVDSEEREKSYL